MIHRCIDLASNHDAKVRIASIVTDKRGRILSSGLNSYTKTHPVQKKYAVLVGQPMRQFLHSEMISLLRCQGEPYALYVVRLDSSGRMALAKPCKICEAAAREKKIKEVYYSVDANTIHRMKL